MGTQVKQYSLKGELIAEYPSIKVAALYTKMCAKSISRCCAGKRKSYNGFIWIRAKDSDEVAKPRLSQFKPQIELKDGEIWRDVKGYEGLYQVSNLGRIKSVARTINVGIGCRYQHEQIKAHYLDEHGYPRISLCKDSKTKQFFVHRLVCVAFVKNIRNSPEVNHINGVKDDNRVENLEWCTRSENEQHAYDTGLAKGQKGYLRPMAKPIRLVHLITKEVLRFGCIADCARFFEGKQKNLEARLRYHANRNGKSVFRGYMVEFISA